MHFLNELRVRLKEYMKRTNTPQLAVCKATRITPFTMRGFLKGFSEPRWGTLQKIIKYLSDNDPRSKDAFTKEDVDQAIKDIWPE